MQQAKIAAELEDNNGNRYTLHALSDRTGLAVDTLMKVFACEIGVDKQTLKAYFRSFDLTLEPADYYYPDPNSDLNTEAGKASAKTAAEAKELEAGTEPRGLEFYIERSPLESVCYETLLQPGSLVRVKAPTLMGKTSLINRVLSQIQRNGYQVVSFSFHLADKNVHFRDTNKLMRWFCAIVSRELGIENKVNDYWDEEQLGAKISCTAYFEEYLLHRTTPLILSLEDVDLLFPYPEISAEFFSLLRSWHEKAKSRPVWKKLRLRLAHTTDVYIRLDINQSPFSVGVPIELSEFTLEQVQDFARQLGLDDRLTSPALLVEMVGGHPYLLQQAFTYLKTHPQGSLEQLLAAAPTEAGIYCYHLRTLWLTLQKHPDLLSAFRAIVDSPVPAAIDPNTTYQLQGIGLVKFVGNQVIARCKLYQQYFSERL